MVRMFGDRLADPVYSRRRMHSDDRKFFSTEFSNPELLSASNPSTWRAPWELLAPDQCWHRKWYERLLEIPVVATDIGSTVSIIEKSAGGVVVPPGNEAESSVALRRIIGDLRRRLIRSGLDFARPMTNEHQRMVIAEAQQQYVPETVDREILSA